MLITCLVTRKSATNQCQSSIIGRTFKQLSSHRRKTFPGPRNISSVALNGQSWCGCGEWRAMAVSDVYRGQRAGEARMRILDLSLTDLMAGPGSAQQSPGNQSFHTHGTESEKIKWSSNIIWILYISYCFYQPQYIFPNPQSKIRFYLDCLQCSFIARFSHKGSINVYKLHIIHYCDIRIRE